MKMYAIRDKESGELVARHGPGGECELVTFQEVPHQPCEWCAGNYHAIPHGWGIGLGIEIFDGGIARFTYQYDKNDTGMQIETVFRFCPNCGRRLTDENQR